MVDRGSARPPGGVGRPVLRDRLGELEDRFFATVFLGSGLLFLAMLFFSAAVMGSIIIAHTAEPTRLLGSTTFAFGRRRPQRGEITYVKPSTGITTRVGVTMSSVRSHRNAIAPPAGRASVDMSINEFDRQS
jgi:hypothetical protein